MEDNITTVKNNILNMVNPDFIAFATWSAITAIFLIVISLVYRRFKLKKNASSSH
jgi:hypothetical protein